MAPAAAAGTPAPRPRRPRRPRPDWAKKLRRDTETGFLPRRRCELYLPGHSVHYIQAIRSSGDPESHVRGEVVSVEAPFVTVVLPDGLRSYRNHEAERLAEILEEAGRVVEVREPWRLMRVPTDGASYDFCIAVEDDPWPPCDDTPLTGLDPAALAERLRTHGGFSVPGPEAVLAAEAASRSQVG